ncbi:MAG: hypothetical protein S4CHLAM6_00800 [Chlamydiae bacterium]|nr:hypothetical protein [Chlamydiota bacterium]
MSKECLQNSFQCEKQSLEHFKSKFVNKYHSILHLPPQLIINNREEVGIVYFENWFKADVIVLSIYLNPNQINQNIGTRAIELASNELFERGYSEIIAFIKPENLAAQKAFQKASFSNLGLVKVPKYGKVFSALKFRLSKRDLSKTFIIGEAGSNCIQGNEERTLQLANTMIEEAYRAGCDAVKFQLYKNDRIYVSNAGKAPYLDQDINEIFKAYALPPHLISKLHDYSKYIGIELMCSFFSEEDFEEVDPFVSKHKVASYEIRHLRLIEKAARSQKPLYLSTGAATIDDIEWAKSVFLKNGGKELTLLHCTAQYPAQAKSLNLNCIPSLKNKFGVPIGLSDHSSHPIYAPVAAVSLGAVAIEKHFTLQQKLPGPDHSFAINCEQLKEMCESIRHTEKILGVAKKEIFPQEKELASIARRGLQAIHTIKKGEKLLEGVNVGILRPGLQRLGLHPKYIEDIHGREASQNIPQGCGIKHDDVIW